MSEKRLTGKQLAFATEYIKCLNATEAARRAGYEGNDVTLGSVGYENLRKPQIASFIEENFKANAMSAFEVVYRLSIIASGDMDDVVDDNGNLDMEKARARGRTGILKKVKSKTFTTEISDVTENEVEVHDKMKALDLLAKYHDLVNRVKVVNWQDEIIALLREGKVTQEQVENELGLSLAQELFNTIGLSSTVSGEDESA